MLALKNYWLAPDLLMPDKAKNIKPEAILFEVAAHYKLTVEEIKTDKRKRPFPEIRFMCYQLMKENVTGITLKEIGAYWGGKDHSSIINGIKMFKNYLDTETEYRQHYEAILKRLEKHF